jgi:hypothetical protein
MPLIKKPTALYHAECLEPALSLPKCPAPLGTSVRRMPLDRAKLIR